MWYAAEDETKGGVGYATSLDGRTWTKVGEVLPPGKPGMPDSYRVMQPCVLLDNGVYFMWYTADDAENRRVAYATSADGLVWQRGGIVFDVGTGNYSEGAFAPAVVRTADAASTCCSPATRSSPATTSRASSSTRTAADGLTWAAGNIAFSASGSDTAFDGYNVSQPTILQRPGATARTRTRCGTSATTPTPTATTTTASASPTRRAPAPSPSGSRRRAPAGDPYYESVLTLGTQGTAFDTMKVADLRPVAKPASAGTGLYGFYTGTNAADFVSRIGVKESTDDGLTWTDAGAHATLIDKGTAGAFDEGGVACPAPVARTLPAAGGSTTPR